MRTIREDMELPMLIAAEEITRLVDNQELKKIPGFTSDGWSEYYGRSRQ
ncbi:MAG: hypothetical protein LBJ20_03675 [Candidatus Methanoplasma sp.]|jgi:hypothetical protein|nr:hypothetical protein [Candidatus Methanoplasma sp.]